MSGRLAGGRAAHGLPGGSAVAEPASLKSLVHLSPFPTAYARALGTGSLPSALSALSLPSRPRALIPTPPPLGASSASGLQERPGRPGFPAICLPAGLSWQLEAGHAEVNQGSSRQPARAGTGCHMVGPWTRSLIQPHSVLFRVRTAHLLRG